MTIHEILSHPEFLLFVAEANACGRFIRPGSFPWKFMGCTDREIRNGCLQFDRGRPISFEQREALLQWVRHTERQVIEHWHWWQGHRAEAWHTCLGAVLASAN